MNIISYPGIGDACGEEASVKRSSLQASQVWIRSGVIYCKYRLDMLVPTLRLSAQTVRATRPDSLRV